METKIFEKEFFSEEDVISRYTSEQATEDGILLETKILKNKIKGIENGPFSHITVNLLKKGGYMTEDENGIEFNFPNLLDLLTQALQIGRRGKKGDWMHSGRIETPNGTKQQIFICQNETGKFTIMLAEDY